MLSPAVHARVGHRLLLTYPLSRGFGACAFAQSENKRPKQSTFNQTPGPMPLGNSDEQKRIVDMIKEANKHNAPPPGLTPKELEKFYEPVVDEKDSLKAFPDNTNPRTGEVNGPRGPEPTRFGDWERKGRVSDF